MYLKAAASLTTREPHLTELEGPKDYDTPRTYRVER